jgi:regulator of replication initiation timing
MEVQLDGAAAHYRQRLTEAEDNCAMLMMQVQQFAREKVALENENARLRSELSDKDAEQLELSLTES